MLGTKGIHGQNHVTEVSQTGLCQRKISDGLRVHSAADLVQTKTTTGFGTKIIECLRKVASAGNLPNMGQIMHLNMAATTKQYSLNEVRYHSDSSSCWIVLADKVYDVTHFLNIHPGGEEIILEIAGTDATIPFESKGHSKDAIDLLEEYCIGELIQEDRRYKT